MSETLERDESRVAASVTATGHGLKRALGLRDLVPMQILLVVGVTWAGIAARQGGTHVWYWLAAILTLFVPLAAVVGWCATVWPYEGGVYQWVKYAMGPFAGFLGAWNFGMWALLAVSNVGILTATSLSYGLGPRAAWMEESHGLILALTVGLFLLILAVNLPGFGIGRWVSHFGTAVTVLVTVLLLGLLFVHPGATAAHPHVNPQAPFSFGMPVLTLLSANLFSKIAFNALSGLEQVAVFAGETRNAGRTSLRSAWIAAPIIAVIYILMTGSMLAYTPAGKIDLTGPIPQMLAAAFGAGGAGAGANWGLLLGRGAILVLAIALVAQYAVIVAETSRLPMVAGWDGIVPGWFTRLDPRWKTPTRSIAVIVAVALVMGIAATAGTGAQEAFQLISSAGNLLYGVYYLLLFAIPLVIGGRFAARPGGWLKLAAVSGVLVTVLSMGFNMLPIVDVANRWVFAAKVVTSAAVLNAIGVGIYWWGTRMRRLDVVTLEDGE
ncbi:MAG: branched-chain amino acid transporter BcaP [Acidobacteriaceae bacterium]